VSESPIRNPYACGHPVQGWEFYGRQDELSRLFTQIARGGHYSVVGGPRTGKTSLLQHMAVEGVAERYGVSGQDRLFAYCNLNALPAGKSMGESLSRALQEALKRRLAGQGHQSGLDNLLESLEQYDPTGHLRRGVESAGQLAGKAFSAVFKNVKEHLSLPTPPPDPDGLLQLSKAFDQLQARNLKPVLLLDDAEPLFSIASDLRKLFAHSGVSFVLATSRSLKQLVTGEPPLEALRLRLGAMDADDARTLLVQPARGAKVEYPADWVERTVAFTGSHPYLLQLYAFHLFPALRDGKSPDRQRLEADVLDEARTVLEEQLAGLSPEEQQRLHQRMQGPVSDDHEADGRLRVEGILTPEGEIALLYRRLGPGRPAPILAPAPTATPVPASAEERSLLEVIEERIRLDTYLRERFTQVGTFVDIDVAGSTALKSGEDDYDIIYSFEEFHRFQRETIESFKGRVLNAIGDETMSLFAEPEEAISCLKGLMGALPEFNRTRNRLKNPFQVRAGVHLGELIRDNKEERAYSRVLDVAGHLQKLAEDGAVVVSQQVYEALGQPAYLTPFKYSERDGVMTFVLQLG
jgi:class 3 adenylate cyclase